MQHTHVRNAILGAGAMGSAAAYHLARLGEPVLLIEQFEIGHDRGSSHGEARITRHSYADERYARLMPEAFREWRQLEADAGATFYLRTGGVSLAPPGGDYVARVAASLGAIGCPHRLMSGRDWNAAAPQFRVAEGCEAVFEPDAGVLLAARAMAAEVALARGFGGDRTQILEGCPVVGIDLDADRPTLRTATLRVTADRLIVAAGPWTGRLFPEFADRLRVERQQVLYLRPREVSPYAIGRFPVFIFKGDGPRDAYYGMPEISGGGVKVARHGGDAIDPDADDRAIDERYVDEVREFLRGSLPDLAEAPVARAEVCKYTVAPEEDFLVDFHPERPDVIVASPCSGHGFKFSALIGRVLADLATTGSTSSDVALWRRPGSR